MNIAIILAGGNGTRLGSSIPKQYIEVKGRPVIGYCLDKFINNDSVDAVQVVADVSWREYISKCIASETNIDDLKSHKHRLVYNHGCKEINNDNYHDNCSESNSHNINIYYSEPGINRQLSIYNALTDINKYASPDDYVMIHDAARPMVSTEFVSKCFEKAKEHDGVMPVLSMKDTVYLSEDGKCVTKLLERNNIFAGQAPEVFVLEKYYEANKALLPDKILSINGSTEPAVLAGMDIALIDGDEKNFKITTKEDLIRFEAFLDEK